MNRKDFAWEPKAAEPSKAAHECTQAEPTCTPRYGIHPQLVLELLAHEGSAAARSREHTMFREERSGLFLFRCFQKMLKHFNGKMTAGTVQIRKQEILH